MYNCLCFSSFAICNKCHSSAQQIKAEKLFPDSFVCHGRSKPVRCRLTFTLRGNVTEDGYWCCWLWIYIHKNNLPWVSVIRSVTIPSTTSHVNSSSFTVCFGDSSSRISMADSAKLGQKLSWKFISGLWVYSLRYAIHFSFAGVTPLDSWPRYKFRPVWSCDFLWNWFSGMTNYACVYFVVFLWLIFDLYGNQRVDSYLPSSSRGVF